MFVDPIFFSPDGHFPQEVEYVVFAIAFEKEDFEGLGLQDGALEYNEQYLGKDEYAVFRAKLKDPLYLHSFYEENEELLKKQYWRRVSRDRFVVDTITSYPTIFNDFKKAFIEKTLYSPWTKRMRPSERRMSKESPHTSWSDLSQGMVS